MKQTPSAAAGHNSPLYYHMKQCYELRNLCHIHWLWLRGDTTMLPSEKAKMLHLLTTAKESLTEALTDAQEKWRARQDIFSKSSK